MTMHTETETPTTHSAMADGETSVPILQLKDVSYAYAKGGRNVLSDINYTFPSGSVTAIVGPSGAGKTTLLSLISGLTTPTGGEVLFEGHNLAKIPVLLPQPRHRRDLPEFQSAARPHRA